MDYLQAAVSLRTLIEETNTLFLAKMGEVMKSPRRMRIELKKESVHEMEMETYSNDYVTRTLDNLGGSNAFVMTDLASMNINGQDMTYLLYKGYHSKIEKGLVLYQIIDEENLSPKGALQFSNLEDNIFYDIDEPKEEESSCNAMETGRKVDDGKSIVFLIGHMNEQRLVYDIQRLIFDTVNNVTKHPRLQFSFIIHIARYGGSPSRELKEQVRAIGEFTRKYVYPVYPNATFEFSYEQDAS